VTRAGARMSPSAERHLPVRSIPASHQREKCFRHSLSISRTTWS
jgi:hypothetical protein